MCIRDRLTPTCEYLALPYAHIYKKRKVHSGQVENALSISNPLKKQEARYFTSADTVVTTTEGCRTVEHIEGQILTNALHQSPLYNMCVPRGYRPETRVKIGNKIMSHYSLFRVDVISKLVTIILPIFNQ